MLILPNTLLDKYDYDLLASKRELKLVCNGKEYFIPINMHKVKNKLEVNCLKMISFWHPIKFLKRRIVIRITMYDSKSGVLLRVLAQILTI